MRDAIPQFPPIPRCLRDGPSPAEATSARVGGPITVPQFGQHPWWRRRWRRFHRIRVNFRCLVFRHPKSATLVINVRFGLSG